MAAPGKGLIESQSLAPVVCSHMSPVSKLAAPGPVNSLGMEFPRKRKGSDSELSQDAHSQTEKRRRDKMNHLIQELSSMIPPCSPTARKLDKLSVLRRAVQHLRSLRGMTESYLENSRPSFIQDKELSHLILKTAEGFLFVVGCERGRILFVSKSVSKTLHYDQAGLMGQNLFDFLHPKDVAKVKEQLSCDVSPRENPVDTKAVKAALPVYSQAHTGRPCMRSGSRRSFFFRMKSCKIPVKEEHQCSPCSKKKAMGRLHPYAVPRKSGEIKVRPTEFVTRFAMNGKFIYVDQRATAILGYLPQELLGTSCYEYFHQDDHSNLTIKHKAVLQSKEKILTDSYKFRVKDGSFITLKSQWFSFTNPWTKEPEYIVSVNTLVLGRSETGASSLLRSSSQSSEDSLRQSRISTPGVSMGTALGAETANEALSLQRLHSSSPEDSSPSETVRDNLDVNYRNASAPRSEVSTKELFSLSPSEMGGLEAAQQHQSTETAHNHEPLLSDGAQLDFDALCDSDDTAMAAFMNYLEAEGGLGDPGDFSDLQWTL